MLSVLCVVEFGKVSRNCTEDGWSEMFPHYVDVCPFDDNRTNPMVRHKIHRKEFYFSLIDQTE